MRRATKYLLRIVIVIVVLVVLLIAGVVVAVNVSPRPMAWLTRKQFASVSRVTPPGYDEQRRSVRVEKDIEYPSRFGSNRLDVFSPTNFSRATILWVHGGGFVGGDKADIEIFATMLAARSYTVVSMNYALAPESVYPNPILQVYEVYQFLIQNKQRFPMLTLDRLIVGGDSAGAQIASQFVALQTNPELAKSMQLDAIVPSGELLAAILYCGPYDLKGLHDSGSWFGRFFVRQMGWSYFGTRNWRDTPQAAQASTIDHVTPNFPATFITDGNTGSFEGDARSLEAKIAENRIYTESLYYYAPEHGKLGHEYQFDFSKPEAMECYQRTLGFLEFITGFTF